MLIVMSRQASREDVDNVVRRIEKNGWTAKQIPGGDRTAIGVLRNSGAVEPSLFLDMPGVREAIPVSKPYKLVSREMHPEDTRIEFDSGLILGDGRTALMAGPCAVESEAQALTIAEAVKKAGAQFFRGGAFKPRSSPYSFQGLGEKGLEILARVRQETGLHIVTEATDHEVLDMVEEFTDIIQIGTRNMQNYRLLRRAGQAKKPVLLKRGMSATIDEFFMAAEYIMAEGNSQVILCERGIRTFTRHSRNTLDLNAIPYIKQESHLPVVVDPSHAAGRRHQVVPLARAAAAVGVDGLIVEVHNRPEKAMSDGPQSLYPEQFSQLVRDLERMNISLS